MGEDDEQLIEIFKAYKKAKVELKGIEAYYTTDLRQLSEELDTSLISFKLDEEMQKYKMEIIKTSLLEK